ncbi:MAG: hydrogenase formation protein HypD [Candidatus Lokiarchaeota archaeon]|nr:hydrogenase formation protein HypD [Candidatus Lokiarchaeota archaeon]
MIRFDTSGVFHDKAVAAKLLAKIDEYLDGGRRPMRVMHVCGTHEHVIAQAGIRSMLPKNVEVISGPGCPVCVCHTGDIYKALTLAREGHIVATFGDMMRVPSERGSLQDAHAKGCDVRVVYAIDDAVAIARENPGREVVFFAVGFETFAPVVASSVASGPPPNFSFLCALKTITPVMELLLSLGNVQLDGFVTPGHVSAIIGTDPYEVFATAYKMPIVTAGFQPNDILLALAMLARQVRDGAARNENEYTGIVAPGGNAEALAIMHEVFEEATAVWRGIGPVPHGGLSIRAGFSSADANARFGLDAKVDASIGKDKGIPPGCSCHLVIMGQMKPAGCPLFRSKKCNPENPIGPCMVSDEGTCKIASIYRDED